MDRRQKEQRLETLREAIGAQHQQGRFGAAGKLQLEVSELARELFGEASVEYAHELGFLGILFRNDGALDPAEDAYRKAIGILRQVENGIELSAQLNNLGIVYKRRGRLQEARALYEESLAIRRAHRPEQSLEVANGVLNLGILLEEMGDLKQARSLYNRALESARALGEDGSPLLTTAVTTLGTLYMRAGELHLSEPLLREGLERAAQEMPPEHPKFLQMEINFGQLLLSLNRAREALELLEPLTPTLEATFGLEHPATGIAHGLLGAARAKLTADTARAVPAPENPDEAMELQIRVDLAEIERTLHPRVIAVLTSLTEQGDRGPIRELMQEHPETRPVLTSIVEQFESAAELQHILAALKADADVEARIELCRRALRLINRESYPRLWFQLQSRLGTLLYDPESTPSSERLEPAIEAVNAALEITPPTVPATQWASLLSTLGLLYHARTDGDPAENLDKAIEAYERALKAPEHRTQPELYASTQNNLANAYAQSSRGDRDENLTRAVVLYQQVLRARTREASPISWARIQNNLGNTYVAFEQDDTAVNRERGIRALQEALTVRTLDAMPQKWAETTLNLGHAWRARVDGDRSENLREARHCYQEVLRVWMLETEPLHYQQALELLGVACLEDKHWKLFGVKPSLASNILLPLTLEEIEGLVPDYPELERLHEIRQREDNSEEQSAAYREQQQLRSVMTLFGIQRAQSRRRYLELHGELHDARVPALLERIQRSADIAGAENWGSAFVAMTEEQALLSRWNSVGLDRALEEQKRLEDLEDRAAELLRELRAQTPNSKEFATLMHDAAAAEALVIGPLSRNGSESIRRRYLARKQERLDAFISLSLSHRQEEVPALAACALQIALCHKGLEAELSVNYRDLAEVSGNDQVASRWRTLQSLRRQISEKVLTSGVGEGATQYRSTLLQLRLQQEACEFALAELTPAADIEARLDTVTLSNVARALPGNGALLEYLRVTVTDGGAENAPTPHYVAWVLIPETPERPVLLDLGTAAAIDVKVATLRQALARAAPPGTRHFSGGTAQSADAVRAASRELRALVFDPVRGMLRGARILHLSPDGDLALFPFEILAEEGSAFLIDTFQFQYLLSGRDLARPPMREGRAPSAALVMADPAYDWQGPLEGEAPREKVFYVEDLIRFPGDEKPEGRPLEHPSLQFDPLPGARTEGERVALVLGVEPLLGEAALKNTLLECTAPLILHLATHGFFLEDRGSSAHEGSRATLVHRLGLRMVHREENPLMRSWLVLAAVNQWLRYEHVPVRAGNCVLTAADAATLDLAGTELVVLSACESGLGVVQAGEGVVGLRRAFALAGARTVVMSMWRVSDEVTQMLMDRFYQLLLAGTPRAQALRTAQLEIKKRHPHPLSWGAFICEGDARPLPPYTLSSVQGIR